MFSGGELGLFAQGLSASASAASQGQQASAHGHHRHRLGHRIQAHVVKADVAFAAQCGPRKAHRDRLANHGTRTRRGVDQAKRIHRAGIHLHGVGGQKCAARHHPVGQGAAGPQFGRAARGAARSTLQVIQGVGAVRHKDVAELLRERVVAIREGNVEAVLARGGGVPDSSVCATRRRRTPTRHLGR